MNFKKELLLNNETKQFEWATFNCVPREKKAKQLVRNQRSVLFYFYYFDCTSRGSSKLKQLSRIYGSWNVIRLNYSDCKEEYFIKLCTKPNEIPGCCKSLCIHNPPCTPPPEKLKKFNLCLFVSPLWRVLNTDTIVIIW